MTFDDTDQLPAMDLTPTWAQAVNILAVLLRDGDHNGQRTALAEMRRMAHLADAWVAHVKGLPE